MRTLVFLGAPFALATLLSAAWPRAWRPWRTVLGLGVLLAVGFVLYIYLSAPLDYEHDEDQCNHCQQFLGRWWEPAFVFWLAVVDYFAWSVGVAVGAGVHAFVTLVRRRITPDGV